MDNVLETFKLIVEGGMFGAAGQGIQVFVSLIISRGHRRSVRFSGLCRNILVGFGIGSLVVLFLIRSAASQISFENILTLLALGYAGGDVIDKIVRISSRTPTLRPPHREQKKVPHHS